MLTTTSAGICDIVFNPLPCSNEGIMGIRLLQLLEEVLHFIGIRCYPIGDAVGLTSKAPVSDDDILHAVSLAKKGVIVNLG